VDFHNPAWSGFLVSHHNTRDHGLQFDSPQAASGPED
jgi:hypothetical protein